MRKILISDYINNVTKNGNYYSDEVLRSMLKQLNEKVDNKTLKISIFDSNAVDLKIQPGNIIADVTSFRSDYKGFHFEIDEENKYPLSVLLSTIKDEDVMLYMFGDILYNDTYDKNDCSNINVIGLGIKRK